jgi:hypothetical protein
LHARIAVQQLAAMMRIPRIAFVPEWTILGLVRGFVQLSLSPASLVGAFGTVAIDVLDAWYWIPVSYLVVKGARSDTVTSSRLATALWVSIGLVLVIVSEPEWRRAITIAANGHGNPWLAIASYHLDTNIVLYAACVSVAWADAAMRTRTLAGTAAGDLEVWMSEFEVHVATMQLQPHFLFNALHLISERAVGDLASARRLLEQLRALLCQSFGHTTAAVVPLRAELAFLGAYLCI